MNAAWTIHDASGAPVATHERYTKPDGRKAFRWKWHGEPRPMPSMPLYRPESKANGSHRLAVLCEGEKSADSVAARGAHSFATVCGAACTPGDDALRPLLDFERIVFWADADEPGRAHMARIAARLAALGHTDIRTLEHGDEKADAADFDGDAQALAALLETAQPFAPGTLEADGDEWAEPVPLPSTPPVPAFQSACLPDAFAPWCTDIADRMGCAPEFPAVAAMVAAGSLIGRQVFIRPKQRDSWAEPANLWGAVIGDPAAMKSPGLSEALAPLRMLEAKAAEAFDCEYTLYERELLAWRGVEAAAKKQAAKCSTMESARAALDELPDPPTPPAHRRFHTSDATPEKLCTILQENPNGVLVQLDELSGLFHAFQRQGREGSRQLYLTGWGGKESHTVDRIARGTGHLPAVCISLLGTIQPRVLRELLLQDDARDGLAARLQLAVQPDLPSIVPLEARDRLPDFAARDRYFARMEGLATLDPAALGAEPDDRTGSHFFRFDADAQAFFYEWHDALLHRVRDDDMPDALREHLSKYRGLLPRLALVCHIVDGGRGPVGVPAFLRAEAWCTVLEAHARRIYAVTDPTTAAARTILDRAGQLPDAFTARDVLRPQWGGLTDKDTATEALGLLAELGWIRATLDRGRPGRPTRRYRWHPTVREKRKDTAA